MAEDEDDSDCSTASSSTATLAARPVVARARAGAAVSSIVDHLAQAESWTAGAAARVAAAQSNRRRGAGPTVYLNVYDLSNVGGTDLTGYVSIVEPHVDAVLGRRLISRRASRSPASYSYGYCEEGTGVFACEPRDACGGQAPGHPHGPRAVRRAHHRKEAREARGDVAGRRLRATAAELLPLLRRLCRLGVGPIPAWVNGLAASVRGATEFSLFGASQAPSQRVKPSVAVDVDDAASDATSQTGTTDDGRREETDDSFDSTRPTGGRAGPSTWGPSRWGGLGAGADAVRGTWTAPHVAG